MVTTEVKKLSSCRKELNIVMAKADIEPIREKELQKVRKTVQVPGFRKGKAPINMVKNAYGQHIEAYTMETAVQDALETAIREKELQVVGMPDPKKVDFNDDGDLTMTIEVDVYPEIEVKAFKDFEFTKDSYVIKDSFVDENINRLLKQHATREEIEGKVEEGQIVTVDMQELDEGGSPIKNKKYNDITITIGDGRFDPELEKELLGLESGKAHKVTKVYPEDFAQKEMAGKKEHYEIAIKKIEKETLPELDDAFVEKVNPNAKSVDEFKKSVEENIKNDYEREADNRLSQDVSQKLLEENPFDVPDALVDNYLNNIIRDAKQRDPNADEKMLREYYRTEAINNMKWHYLKEQIGKDEKIETDEKDIEEFLDKIDNEEIRKIYKENEAALAEVKHSLLDKKIYDFIIENSKVEQNEVVLD